MYSYHLVDTCQPRVNTDGGQKQGRQAQGSKEGVCKGKSGRVFQWPGFPDEIKIFKS